MRDATLVDGVIINSPKIRAVISNHDVGFIGRPRLPAGPVREHTGSGQARSLEFRIQDVKPRLADRLFVDDDRCRLFFCQAPPHLGFRLSSALSPRTDANV